MIVSKKRDASSDNAVVLEKMVENRHKGTAKLVVYDFRKQGTNLGASVHLYLPPNYGPPLVATGTTPAEALLNAGRMEEIFPWCDAVFGLSDEYARREQA